MDTMIGRTTHLGLIPDFIVTSLVGQPVMLP